MNNGFTLIELLVVVAIIGILSAIGIPYYQGYTDTSEQKVVQNNLRTIYMQQQEYYRRNAEYYFTGATCTDSAAIINTNLFSGQNIIQNGSFTYCVTRATVDDFTAQARNVADSITFTINQSNVTSF